MKYVYPAIFTPDEDGFQIRVPDLSGLVTFGATLPDALEMAQDAVEMWLAIAEENKEDIPPASKHDQLQLEKEEFVNLVPADTDDYRRRTDTKAVKKTLTIPSWLNHEAERLNAPYSQILQEGLKKYVHDHK